jgi:hypothetical protein
METTRHCDRALKADKTAALIRDRDRKAGDYLFPSRSGSSPHLSTRQYARLIRRWAAR